MYKKILLSLAVFLISFSGVFSSLTFAAEKKESKENFSQEEIDAVAEEIQFYFEEVGQLDENGNYHIHNYELLEEKANSGDETAQGFIEQINFNAQENGIATPANLQDYAGCILSNFFGTEIALISGDLINSVVGYINDGAWQAVARIVLESIGGSVSKANIVSSAAQLAIYAGYCGGRQLE